MVDVAVNGTEPVPAVEAAVAAEPDWKAEVARLKTENEALLQRTKSAEGRIKAASSPQELAELHAELRRLTREVRRSGLQAEGVDEEVKARTLGELKAEEERDTQQTQLTRYASRLANRINRRLERASIPIEHPEVQKALVDWSAARSTDAYDDVFDKLEDFIEGETASRTKKAADDAAKAVAEATKRGNQVEGTLSIGPKGGSPASSYPATAEDIDKLFVDWDRERPAETNPYADRYRNYLRTGKFS